MNKAPQSGSAIATHRPEANKPTNGHPGAPEALQLEFLFYPLTGDVYVTQPKYYDGLLAVVAAGRGDTDSLGRETAP